jgi:beta-lactamase regulating signal transducer with metallopeptidase domain
MILQAFVRGAIVIAIAALFATLLRHRSAALRHHVWATAVVVQLSLLAFIPVLPTLHLPIIPTLRVQADAPMSSAPREPENRSNEIPGPSIVSAAQEEASAPHPRTAAAPDRTFADYLLIAWMLGAALIFARYLIGTLMMLRVAAKGERVEDGEWLVLAQRTARELGITRPITMIWGDKVAVPITWGVLYPMILLPTSAQDWPLERRRFVLVHEMAHVKRFDALTQLLAQITAAIFWFSPFVWFAEWRMRIEREHACDDTVIEHGTEPTLYADQLLQMVRSLVRRRTQQPAFAALAMARKSEFEGRMLAILDPERPRRVTGVTSGVVFALLSILIAAPLAAVDPFAFRVVTTSLPTTEPIQVTDASNSNTECDFDASSNGTTATISGDPNGFDVRLQRGARCVAGDIAGPVKISADERRILSVDAGGMVRLRELTPGRELELTIEHTSGAGLRRAFTINNRVPDDDGRTEREWVARILPELLQEGAIDPQSRVLRMLKSNGLSATLTQIRAISSPSARLSHFKALIAASSWTAAELSRIRESATASLKSSPRDLAAFQGALSQVKQSPSAATKSSSASADTASAKTDIELMDQILRGINSSYDLHLAMKSQLPRASREVLLVFARNAMRMSSGYELRLFLVESKDYFLKGGDVALEDAWFDAVKSVDSPYDRSMVLVSVLDAAPTTERVTLRMMGAMEGMSTTSDRAAVLMAMARKKLINSPATRTAFLRHVNLLATSSDRRAVLEALN